MDSSGEVIGQAGGLDKGTRGDRLQVVVYVEAEVLEDPLQPGVTMLEDGGDVSAETSRRQRLCRKTHPRPS